MPAQFMTVAAAREQVEGLERAVLDTGFVDLGMQLAACYVSLGRIEDAARIHGTVWEQMRTPETALNYCVILRELGRHEEAAAFSELAWQLDPDDPYLKLLHAETLLRQGHWRPAWPLYDAARLTKRGERMRLQLPGRCRMWQGQELGEREFLFVLMEGGIGDRINYARWCMKLGERVKHWKLYSYEPQAGLFLRWLGRERVVLDGDRIPEMRDAEWQPYWTTVFALPANFAAGPGDVPQWSAFAPGAGASADGRLKAGDQVREKFAIARPADGLPVIGLCWEAAELSPVGDAEARKGRSLTDAQAMRLVCSTADKVHWVSAQWNRTLGAPMTRIPFKTWEDTAAVLENLDAVLSVDTGTMHLAGALCRPLGIILGANSDWKFMAKGKCPFYRTAKLYRNGAPTTPVSEGGGMDCAVDLAIAAIRRDGLGAFG